MSNEPLAKLRPKQKQLVLNLLDGQNVKEAKLNAGYSDSTDPWELLRSDKVQRAIQQMRQPAQWYGRKRLHEGIEDAVNLLLEIIKDKDYGIDLRIECAKDLLDRCGLDFGSVDEEINLGLGVNEETGEIGEILLNLKEREKNESE